MVTDFESYESVKLWMIQLRKTATATAMGQVPPDTYSACRKAIRKYTAYTGMNPDELIADAEASLRRDGTMRRHNRLLDAFLDQCSSRTVGHQQFALIKSFYKGNDIPITTCNAALPTVRKKTLKPNPQQIRAICDVAPIQHSSWILANNYMGLRVGAIVDLVVDDFQTDNWAVNQPLYPVYISKQLSGTFNYTTWIGNDAMTLLRTYFTKMGFQKHDRPWNYDRAWMNKVFKMYAHKAGVIPAPDGCDKDGVPKGLCPLHSHTQRMQRQTIQESVQTNSNWIRHILGHKPPGSDASYSFPAECTPEDLYNEVLKALPKLEVYGHHELSPTTSTVELQKMKAMRDLEMLPGMTPDKLGQIKNLLKHARLASEINEAIAAAT